MGISAPNCRQCFNQEVKFWLNVPFSFPCNSLTILPLRIVYQNVFHQSLEKDNHMSRLLCTPFLLFFIICHIILDNTTSLPLYLFNLYIYLNLFPLQQNLQFLCFVDNGYSIMLLLLPVTSNFMSFLNRSNLFYIPALLSRTTAAVVFGYHIQFHRCIRLSPGAALIASLFLSFSVPPLLIAIYLLAFS